jgi:metallo-beta-lactamase family protein
MHLVEAAGRKILLDCGRSRILRHEARLSSRDFPFAPDEIDAVVLSHAHSDHTGNLPNLVRQGFSGPIYCTPATRDLTAVMLSDAARHHEEDAFIQNMIGRQDDRDTPWLYRRQHVEQTLKQCLAVPYSQTREISPDIRVRLENAGHILGSAMVVLTITGHGREGTITFTGDLGRRGAAFANDPAPVPAADLLICESTYGGRVLESLTATRAQLEEVVRRTIERGGKVLIPAFSLGRTQALIYYLQEGMKRGRIPVALVFVDSPLASDIAEVYRRHAEDFREDVGLLGGPQVSYLRSVDDSKELSARRQPCVILAPGGMCQGGRIVRHLKENIDDPRCSIVLVSYQAPGTLGRKLLEPRARIWIHGRDWNWWADVVEFPGFSGHPDQTEVLASLGPMAGRIRKTRLVHGEIEQAEQLAQVLRLKGYSDVGVPQYGETVTLW